MNIATLKIESVDEKTLDSLRSTLSLVPESTWKKGDSKWRGDLHLSSGFSCAIADAPNPRELIEAIRTQLAVYKERGVNFPSPNSSAELSIGITVGDTAQFAAGLEFAPADLLLLAELGIRLTVWAYPTSDEANEKDTSS